MSLSEESKRKCQRCPTQRAPERGIGLMFVLAGLVAVAVGEFVYMNKSLHEIETELPDMIEQPGDLVSIFALRERVNAII